jgi:colicin import membrane protein
VTLISRPLLLALSLLAGAASAQTAPPADSREAKLERARQLRDQADAMRGEADRRYKVADVACREKFFVNSCLDDAHQAQLDQTFKARELEKQARELERDVKRQDIAEREAKRIQEAPARAAAAAAKAERNRQAVEEAQRERARKRGEVAPQEDQSR